MKKIRQIVQKIWNWFGDGWSEASQIQKRIQEERDRYHRNYWRL
jgi:hypothetical protein